MSTPSLHCIKLSEQNENKMVDAVIGLFTIYITLKTHIVNVKTSHY